MASFHRRTSEAVEGPQRGWSNDKKHGAGLSFVLYLFTVSSASFKSLFVGAFYFRSYALI